MLCYIKPRAMNQKSVKFNGELEALYSGFTSARARGGLPEVKIVYGSLLVSHVDIEREQIHRRQSSATQNLEEGG